MKEKSKSRVGIWNGAMNIAKYSVTNDLDASTNLDLSFLEAESKCDVL